MGEGGQEDERKERDKNEKTCLEMDKDLRKSL